MSDHSDENLCADLVRVHDRDRWLTTAVAPARQRPALTALYALNVEITRIPEITREPMAGLIRHQWWRESLAQADEPRGLRNHPVVHAVGTLVRSGALSGDDVTAFLDAREAEVEGGQPRDLESYEAFCRETGGALSRMAASLLVGQDDTSLQVAQIVGTAHAMVGRLYNVPFWDARGRAILAGEGPDAARAVTERAENLLTVARERAGEVAPAALPALLIGRLAEIRIRRLTRCDHDVYSPKAEPLPHSRPLAVLIGALTGRY